MYKPTLQTVPELHELVKTDQKHNHSKTRRKYKTIGCRFNFGQFFTKRTIVAEPLKENLDEKTKSNILDRRRQVLTSVKQKIDEGSNLSKPDNNSMVNEADIIKSTCITDDCWALSISPDSDFQLHPKSPVDSCFINNCFFAGIKGFAANVDLQPVFNH